MASDKYKKDKEIVTRPLADGVKQVRIALEMHEAYLDYSMSVIVSLALPDVRDGLKPVHRWILFSMK